MKDIQVISAALSDDLRVQIITCLQTGGEMKYTEIMKSIELDVSEDSSKFAYHVGILVDAGLVEKTESVYSLTTAGSELLSSISRVRDNWDDMTIIDTHRKYTGVELTLKIWSSILLFSTPFFLLDGLLMKNSIYPVIQNMMIVVGFSFIVLGVYWKYVIGERIGSIGVEQFQKAGAKIHGEDWMIISLAYSMGYVGVFGIAFILNLISSGRLAIDIFSMSLLGAVIILVAFALSLSVKIPSFWETFRKGEQTKLASSVKLGFYVFTGLLLLSGTIFLVFGIAYSDWGRIGGGVGVLGAVFSMIRDYHN